jgi:hypothetical protein
LERAFNTLAERFSMEDAVFLTKESAESMLLSPRPRSEPAPELQQ